MLQNPLAQQLNVENFSEVAESAVCPGVSESGGLGLVVAFFLTTDRCHLLRG